MNIKMAYTFCNKVYYAVMLQMYKNNENALI